MRGIRSFEDTLKLFREVHGDRYDYFPETYKGSSVKMKIHCNKCGCDFWQTPNKHLLGRGCPDCGGTKKDTLEGFMKKVEEKYPGQYTTSEESIYKNQRSEMVIICKKHGPITIIPRHFLTGCGCEECKNERRNEFVDSFEKRAREVHSEDEELSYEYVKYVNNHTPVKIYCHKKDEFGIEHGIFEQTPSHHLCGQGCPKCKGNTKIDGEGFVLRAKKVHGDKFVYFPNKYIDYNLNTEIKCNKCGKIFQQTPHNHLKGEGCPYCNGNISKPETDISEFIGKYVVIDNNNRKILDNSKEIDILIPSLNIAFEYDGLVWHSEKFGKDKHYHLKKTEECSANGIRLFHIFEDEWVYKREIVESRIKSILGITENRIYGRKCCIKTITASETKMFLNDNHLQGDCKSKYRYGLYYNGELVSVMTFGHLRKNLGSHGDDSEYELLRFCNKLNTIVVGGASKLLKHFISEIKPKRIVSYADRRWSNGNLYEKIGFEHIRNSEPSYFYVIGQRRENRFKYRKDVLVKNGYDKSKTEHEIMLERGIYRIYDCGTMVFEMECK